MKVVVSMAKQAILTDEGLKNYEQELEYLKTVKRKEVAEDLREGLVLNTFTDLMSADASPLMQQLKQVLPAGTFFSYIEHACKISVIKEFLNDLSANAAGGSCNNYYSLSLHLITSVIVSLELNIGLFIRTYLYHTSNIIVI